MRRNKSKSQFWIVLALVNLVVAIYPVRLLLGSDTPDGTILGVVALCGAGLVLGIADVVSVLLAYSTSY